MPVSKSRDRQTTYGRTGFLMAAVVAPGSKIRNWLEAITPSERVSLKRKRSLSEMDSNSTPWIEGRRTADDAPKPTLTRDDAGEGQDSNHTPRSSLPIHLTKSTKLSYNASRSSTSLSTATSSLDRSISNSDTSRKRRRDGSPTKTLAMLKRAEYGVEQRLMPRVKDLPDSLRMLTKAMKDVNSGRGIIAPEQAEKLLSDLAEDEDDDYRLASPLRSDLGGSPDLTFAREIVDHVANNILLARSEAAWNCNAHAPLLDEAWRRSAHKEGLRWENITIANIEPKELLPLLSGTEAVASKRADFAITLKLERDTERLLARCGITSLTQSTYEPLRYSPIAVSFETKLQGENWADANLQLNTWALGQIAKLRELLTIAGRSSVEIPPLPLVVVQGNEWKFLYMEVGPSQAWLWTSIGIGDISCLRGIFQVVTALQRMMEWSQRVYRPWFEQNILDPIIGTLESETII